MPTHDQNAPHDDEQVGQTPALVINCEPLLTRVIEVVGRDGVTYRLRDDVPTDRLLWGFKLLDISQAIIQAGSWDEREAALDERDRERLNLATSIVRHSYPEMTRAEVSAAFTPAQMEELLGYFFTSRLLPLLEQRIASAMQAKEQALATAQAAVQAMEQTQQPPSVSQESQRPQAQRQRAATAGATRSRKRS